MRTVFSILLIASLNGLVRPFFNYPDNEQPHGRVLQNTIQDCDPTQLNGFKMDYSNFLNRYRDQLATDSQMYFELITLEITNYPVRDHLPKFTLDTLSFLSNNLGSKLQTSSFLPGERESLYLEY